MYLTGLEIANFKTFDRLQVALSPLSVLTGANATGKSNLLDALRFVRESLDTDAQAALSRRGGWEQVAHVPSDAEMEFALHWQGEEEFPVDFNGDEPRLQATFHTGVYTLRLHRERGIVAESLRSTVTMRDAPCSPGFERGLEEIEIGDIPNVDEPRLLEVPSANRWRPFLPMGFYSPTSVFLRRKIASLRVYDIDVRLAREAIALQDLGESPRLQEDGRNLAAVLEPPPARDGIEEQVRSLIPGVEEIGVRRAGWSLLYYFREVVGESIREFPSFVLSDGSIRLLAIESALNDPASLVAIEEPERSLHPEVLSVLIDRFREESEHRTVILTTHSPHLVRLLLPEELYLFDKLAGATRVYRPDGELEVESLPADS